MARTSYSSWYIPLTVGEVLGVRSRLALSNLGSQDFGGATPKDENALASAVGRQHAGMYGKEKYERPHEKVATLFFGLVKNHPFPNGNKRTALICSLVALERSCFDLCNTTEEELYDMATSIAADSFPIPKRLQADPDAEVRALAVWFRGRMKRQGTGDHVTNFRELRKILTAHGCEFDAPQGNSIRIRRGPLVAKTGYPRENFEVSVAEVKNIRRKLDLDSLGSSREFYDIDNSVDQFVDDYRYLLWRLADA